VNLSDIVVSILSHRRRAPKPLRMALGDERAQRVWEFGKLLSAQRIERSEEAIKKALDGWGLTSYERAYLIGFHIGDETRKPAG